jgi:ceramide glucosyltransferase
VIFGAHTADDPAIAVVNRIIAELPDRNLSLYNDWFLPSVLVDVNLRGIYFVFGAMSAVRREALDAIGGFEMLAGCLADDFSIGRLIVRRGWRVALSQYTCDTVVSETSFAEMFRHEVRWQRTVFTWPLPWPSVLLPPQRSVVALAVISAHVALRIMLHFLVRRNFRVSTLAEPWLVPLRECVCALAWAGGLFGNSVKWGHQY